MKTLFIGLLAACASSGAFAAKIGILSTQFVLERKFTLMQESARGQGLQLDYSQLDREGDAGARRAMANASLILVDAPRAEDQALIERVAGAALRESTAPVIRIVRFSHPPRISAARMDEARARRLAQYYLAGTPVNYERMFQLAAGADAAAIPPPAEPPASGIYHPQLAGLIEPRLDAYLAWWEKHASSPFRGKPVIGVEITPSYIADGQTRMLDETIQALEAAGAVPVVFYRRNPRDALLLHEGRPVLNVLLVNTFLGSNPDARRAWYRSLGIPVINLLTYRTGSATDYRKDPAGVSTFLLPFTLTTAEYIGLQDPIVFAANEGGEFVTLPEQLDLVVGKALRLAQLQLTQNAQKRVALLFWNHPPGETNQGASNLNVPRSLELLISRLRAEGYAFGSASEAQIIAAAGRMLRPAYRPDALAELMQSSDWDLLPLADYRRWYDKLPSAVRGDIERQWGPPQKSAWIARARGTEGFVVPRMKLGNLVVMPQPPRAETAAPGDEKKLYHDTKLSPSHAYLAAYLWIRERYAAHAIVHFGTHGTQEWTPGKERGLWAFDSPNLLVGNVPVVYPYIVDNIGEAIHVKRRGRGVVVSHQTPPFGRAGLPPDLTRLKELATEYRSLDQGPVREASRSQIVSRVIDANLHQDLKWPRTEIDRDFDRFLRELDDHLEQLGAALQPLGLHTLGQRAEPAHLASTLAQMLGQPPEGFVEKHVLAADVPADGELAALAEHGRRLLASLDAEEEIGAVIRALSARWIDPSYGGDPIRSPDSLPTGRNLYGFDPSRVPTRTAYEAGKQAMDELLGDYRAKHGNFPAKLAFTLWSTEAMRHFGLLEAQVLHAMGVRPKWDEGGRVTGMEVVPYEELKRPRVDAVISITGLYRDQFPAVMERLNEALALVAALDEPAVTNPIRANTARVRKLLLARGVDASDADAFAITRIFGNESGDYGTRLPQATLASDKWSEGDGRLESLYLSRMSWAYGPDPARWSRKPATPAGAEINAYAEHLKGTSAAVFSRSSNLRGLLDTDHPFEYLGGIAMAVRHLDGASPELYISNLRDPARATLQTADRFLATELRSIYQHPGWLREMMKEGYAGTLQMLNAVNNFWGWQVMDRGVVREDQWREFHAAYVNDRHGLGLREYFEKANPAALAQIAERMLEAIRKDYWKADERTKRELAALWQDLARRHDVHTSNQAFKRYVSELATRGYGLGASAAATNEASHQAAPQAAPPPVRGQEMREVERRNPAEPLMWIYAWLLAAALGGGIAYQAWRTRREPAWTLPTAQGAHR